MFVLILDIGVGESSTQEGPGYTNGLDLEIVFVLIG